MTQSQWPDCAFTWSFEEYGRRLILKKHTSVMLVETSVQRVMYQLPLGNMRAGG